MKPIRPPKRSVSPLAGLVPLPASLEEESSLEQSVSDLENSVASLGNPADPAPKALKIPEDLRFLPAFIRKIADAPANDAPELSDVCHFLLLFQGFIEEKKWTAQIDRVMLALFNHKTDLFLIDHQDKEHCEKMGLQADHRDSVLFSRERDILVGRYFAPAAELQPGKFSEFIARWVESNNIDRLLHFLDFCAGSKNPTFEHYLLFTHPALARIVRDKNQLRGLFDKVQPLLKKLSSPTWEKDVRAALGV